MGRGIVRVQGSQFRVKSRGGSVKRRVAGDEGSVPFRVLPGFLWVFQGQRIGWKGALSPTAHRHPSRRNCIRHAGNGAPPPGVPPGLAAMGIRVPVSPQGLVAGGPEKPIRTRSDCPNLKKMEHSKFLKNVGMSPPCSGGSMANPICRKRPPMGTFFLPPFLPH